MKKRLIAMAAAVCTFVSGFGALTSVSAEETDPNLLFEDNFESDTTLKSDWKKTGGYEIVNSGDTAYGNVMKFGYDTHGWHRIGYNIGTVNSGILNVTFDMNIDTFDTTAYNYPMEVAFTRVELNDGCEAKESDTKKHIPVLRIAPHSDGVLYASPTNVYNDAVKDTSSGKVGTGTWVNVSISLDLDNDKMSYYYDGVLAYTNTDTTNISDLLYQVSGICIEGMGIPANAAVKFDNFKVTKSTSAVSGNVNTIVEDFNDRYIDTSVLKNAGDKSFTFDSYVERTTGDYAYKFSRISGTGVGTDSNMHNLFLNIDLTDAKYTEYTKTTGKTVIEFDYCSNAEAVAGINNIDFKYVKDSSTNSFFIDYADSNQFNSQNTKVCDSINGVWYHIQTTIDYDNSQQTVKIADVDNNILGTMSGQYNTSTLGAANLFKFTSWAKDTTWFMLDNLTIKHTEPLKITAKSEGGYTVTSSAPENAGETVCVGLAYYDADGRFISASRQTVASNAISVDFADCASTYTTATAFLWDSITGLNEYCDAVSITK